MTTEQERESRGEEKTLKSDFLTRIEIVAEKNRRAYEAAKEDFRKNFSLR